MDQYNFKELIDTLRWLEYQFGVTSIHIDENKYRDAVEKATDYLGEMHTYVATKEEGNVLARIGRITVYG